LERPLGSGGCGYQCARAKRAEEAMNAEYVVTGVVALLLLGYLIFALLKPEKF
jgi:K+-transporting ATPase KdpF subunit